MKIVAIVGSLRKESFNMQLIKTIEKRYSHLFKWKLRISVFCRIIMKTMSIHLLKK